MDILYAILEYISNNKTIVVGVATTLAEVFVIFWNMRKRLKSKQFVLIARNPVDIKHKAVWKELGWKDVIWCVNPVNLFRKS